MSAPRTRRTALRSLLGALGVVALAGCGVLPPLPEPVPAPTHLVPAFAAQETPDGAHVLTPDGSDAVRRMALRIRNVRCDGIATGSGFAIDSRTLITNKHVVEDSKSLQIATYDGRDVSVDGASTAALADLAIIRTSEDLPSSPTLADSDPVAGDDVTVVGYPEGGKLTVTQGTVLRATADPLNSTLGEVLLTDAEVEPGSSGSAALDSAGHVIGVVYAKTGDGLSLLVPVSTLRSMLDDADAFAPVTACS